MIIFFIFFNMMYNNYIYIEIIIILTMLAIDDTDNTGSHIYMIDDHNNAHCCHISVCPNTNILEGTFHKIWHL